MKIATFSQFTLVSWTALQFSFQFTWVEQNYLNNQKWSCQVGLGLSAILIQINVFDFEAIKSEEILIIFNVKNHSSTQKRRRPDWPQCGWQVLFHKSLLTLRWAASSRRSRVALNYYSMQGICSEFSWALSSAKYDDCWHSRVWRHAPHLHRWRNRPSDNRRVIQEKNLTSFHILLFESFRNSSRKINHTVDSIRKILGSCAPGSTTILATKHDAVTSKARKLNITKEIKKL